MDSTKDSGVMPDPNKYLPPYANGDFLAVVIFLIVIFLILKTF